MIACRICTANGHEAIKLPSGRYVCPMKIAVLELELSATRAELARLKHAIQSIELVRPDTKGGTGEGDTGESEPTYEAEAGEARFRNLGFELP